LMPRQLARVRERLPEARLVSLEGCGHVPTWDDPERIGRLLLDRT
jgi:pimeloyl-ACP methyl ester carboxylesterase